MKILIPHPFNNVSEGLAQTIVSIGEQEVIWNVNQPIYDALERSKPDIALCNRQHLRHTVTQALEEYNVKLVNLDEFDIQPAANLAYTNIQYNDKYASDILYVSIDTKPEELIYLQELINRQYNIKIVGNKIPVSNYLGMCSLDDIVRLMKSCKIALAFDVWTLYTYAVNKVFCLTTVENDIYPQFTNTEQLLNLLSNYLEYSTGLAQTQHTAITEAYNYIINGHTFFHRGNELFNKLGYTEQADKCLQKLNEIIQQNN